MKNFEADMGPEVGKRAAQFLETAMKADGLDVTLISKMNIVADELLANILSYSNAGKIRVGYEYTGDAVILEFSDNGIPYDPTQRARDKEKEEDGQTIGGWGLTIVRKMTDSFTYRYENGMNCLKVSKNFN